MEPNFENGDYLIVDELSFRFRDPQRGEVVVFKYPQNLSQRYIKRIIGLPGETIEIKGGKVTISGQEGSQALDESNYLYLNDFTSGEVRIPLTENEYFVMGDNRFSSSDSRSWGPLPKDDIIGRVVFRAWPFAVFAKIEAPSY